MQIRAVSRCQPTHAGSMKPSGVRAAGLPGNRSIAAWPALSSKYEQCHVVSRRTPVNPVLRATLIDKLGKSATCRPANKATHCNNVATSRSLYLDLSDQKHISNKPQCITKHAATCHSTIHGCMCVLIKAVVIGCGPFVRA